MTTQNVSMTAPTDYSSEALAIERRRKLAEALQAQGMQQQPTEVVGGWAIPQGRGGVASKLAQSLAGAYGQQQADQQEKGLASKYQNDMLSTVLNAERARLGSPAQTIQPDPQEAQQSADQGTPSVGPATSQAVPPNVQLANALLMGHPATQSLGLQGMQRDMAMQSVFGPTGAPGSGTQAAGTQGAGTTPMGMGGPAPSMDTIQKALLSGDPTLAKWGEAMLSAQKGIAQRPNAPVVNPITGQVIAQPVPTAQPGQQVTVTPQGPQVGVLPGYGPTQTALSNIPLSNAPMQTIKLSNQRELQLTQPEYLQYTQSGGQVLPSRYSALAREIPSMKFQDPGQAPAGGSAAAPKVKPQAQQSQGRAADVGVVGATQSQSEQIEQARQTAGGKAVDEQFGKDYVAFRSGGAQDAAKILSQLQDVSNALKNPKANLTGPFLGSTPDVVQKFTNPQAIAMRERVEEVVQRSLRAILGAQFTEKEGERLIARAYNPNLSESENAIRVDRLMTQLQQAYQAKADAAQYFEKNGTLQGWRGKLPTMSDFDPESRSAAGKVSGNVPWNSLTPK